MNYDLIKQVTPQTVAIVSMCDNFASLGSTFDYLFDGTARNVTSNSTSLVQGESFGKPLFLLIVSSVSEVKKHLTLISTMTKSLDDKRVLIISHKKNQSELEKQVKFSFSEFDFYPLA